MITPDEQHVMRTLASAGIAAEKVPESPPRRTPDLLAHDDANRYLIEVKGRTDDETLTRELRDECLAHRTTPIAWGGTVAAIFDDAIKQLDAAGDAEALKLIWLRVRSQRGSKVALADQARYTLYGIRRIHGSDRGKGAPLCFFFGQSTFHKYQRLDAVFIEVGGSGWLCVNTYSRRLAELKNSRLGKFLKPNIFDPVEMEQAGHLIADCPIDRRRSDLVLQYVSSKYGIQNAVPFNMDAHSTWGVVNDTELG